MDPTAFALVLAAIVFLVTIAKGQKAKARQSKAAMPVEDPTSPVWHRSERGNLTRQLPDGQFVTVFKAKDGWKFSAPFPPEHAEEIGDDTFFSWPMDTEEDAIKAANNWTGE